MIEVIEVDLMLMLGIEVNGNYGNVGRTNEFRNNGGNFRNVTAGRRNGGDCVIELALLI